jgi:hypothetical protein
MKKFSGVLILSLCPFRDLNSGGTKVFPIQGGLKLLEAKVNDYVLFLTQVFPHEWWNWISNRISSRFRKTKAQLKNFIFSQQSVRAGFGIWDSTHGNGNTSLNQNFWKPVVLFSHTTNRTWDAGSQNNQCLSLKKF